MRRIGRDFSFCCVVVLEILQYFCVLPPCKDEESPASAVEDFCGECPLTATRRMAEDILEYFEITQQSGRAGILRKNALCSYCIV